MEHWKWRPNVVDIAVSSVVISGIAALHLIYGIRFRWTNLGQQNQNKDIQIEPLLAHPATQRISILTQNIWCVFFNGGMQRRKRLRILIDCIARDEPDIIALQEMSVLGLGFILLCGDYLYVQKKLIKMGYIYHTDPKLSTPYFGSSSGCVIFSKYPITDSSANVFKHRRIARCKGWIFAQISIPNIHDLKITNTHLEHRDRNIQYEQMKEIVKDIGENIYIEHKSDNNNI